MTREEFINLTKALKTFYPRENLLPNMEAMELWYRELSDIPYTVAEAALRKYVSTNKFSPTIADIREMAASVSNGDKPLWSDGWDKVLRAIKKYGSYGQAEAMASLDELTRQAVKRLGYLELCRSENIMADRANFRMIFEQLADRQQQSNQISVNLTQLIEGIQQETRKGAEGIEHKTGQRLSIADSKA